jgi:ABC-type transport system involved in multi-copper enzyme maturation permease subunit
VARLSGLVVLTLLYALVLELMLVPAILFWPEFSANLETIRSMARNVPILGDEMVSRIEESGFPAYVLAQHFFKGANALGTAAAILFAAPAVAGEVQRGTLELLLARPYSRARLLLERWAAGAAALVLPVFLTSLTIPLLAARVEEYESAGPYLACAVHQSLFLLALYAATFLGSCLGSNPNRLALVALFLAVSQFALYMVKRVTHVSLFRLCDMDVLMATSEGRWNPAIVLALALTVALCLGASLLAFRRRCP